MLKALAWTGGLALVSFVANPATAGALPEITPGPSDLVVGSVHDQSGRPIGDGTITVFGATGEVLGRGRTDGDGTFAIGISEAPSRLGVECPHCAPFRSSLRGGGPVALIVTRFRALERAGPDEADLAVLPYRDPIQAAALIPYAVTISSGQNVASLSDRGLERGRALVLDGGAPVYDLSTGDQGLYAFPGRALGSIEPFSPTTAFTYGNYAGGGIFALDRLPEQSVNSGAYDEGGGYALALAARAGPLAPALAESIDDTGITRRRADLNLTTGFAGGFLRVEASSASQNAPDLNVAADESRDLLSLAYVTESRLARTSLGADVFSALGDALSYTNPWPYGTASSGFDANFRVEHPGQTTLAFGAVARVANGLYSSIGIPTSTARYDDELAYVEASHSGTLSYDLGLSAARTGVLSGEYHSARTLVLLPSAKLRADLGDGFDAGVSASSSLRAPTISELAISDRPGPGFSLERSSLFEGDVGYDEGHRLRFDATAFREVESGFDSRSLDGLGFGLTWQIAPRLSLRAWTLHDSVAQDMPAFLIVPYADSLGASFGRGLLWASYQAPGGLRFDAIARREIGVTGDATYLDADASIPLIAGLSLTAGTSRSSAVRRTYVGLRFPRT